VDVEKLAPGIVVFAKFTERFAFPDLLEATALIGDTV
jgi:hypothetical protein